MRNGVRRMVRLTLESSEGLAGSIEALLRRGESRSGAPDAALSALRPGPGVFARTSRPDRVERDARVGFANPAEAGTLPFGASGRPRSTGFP
jgi:hypothetical protein